MAGLFESEQTGTPRKGSAMVTAIAPLAGGRLWSVRVGRRRVATLERRAIEELGVRVGTEWTGRMAKGAAEQQQAAAARRAAVRLLAARSRTRKELLERLEAKGFAAGTAARVADELATGGVLNDLETARGDVRSRSRGRQREARALTEARLEARGVASRTAARAIADELPQQGDLAAARSLALERAKAMDPGLDVEVVRRRVFAHLARRGFDEETCQDAADRAIRRLGKWRARRADPGE